MTENKIANRKRDYQKNILLLCMKVITNKKIKSGDQEPL